MNTTTVSVSGARTPELIRTYVWQSPVRWAHWLVFFSFGVLAFTGIYMGHPFLASPGPSEQRFVMGTVKVVHFYAAIVFTLAVLARIAWMFLGNEYASWKEYLPIRRQRRSGLLRTLAFYLFVRRDPPTFIGHNPLAGAAYTLVFVIYLVMIATGFALYSVSAPLGSHMSAFRVLLPFFGGAQTARWIHHIGMWLLIGFAVHHVYSAVLMARIEKKGTIESIFSGYKFLTRADLRNPSATVARRDDGA